MKILHSKAAAEPILVASACPNMNLFAIATQSAITVYRSSTLTAIINVPLRSHTDGKAGKMDGNVSPPAVVVYTTAMCWSLSGRLLSVGFSTGEMLVYDVEMLDCVRVFMPRDALVFCEGEWVWNRLQSSSSSEPSILEYVSLPHVRMAVRKPKATGVTNTHHNHHNRSGGGNSAKQEYVVVTEEINRDAQSSGGGGGGNETDSSSGGGKKPVLVPISLPCGKRVVACSWVAFPAASSAADEMRACNTFENQSPTHTFTSTSYTTTTTTTASSPHATLSAAEIAAIREEEALQRFAAFDIRRAILQATQQKQNHHDYTDRVSRGTGSNNIHNNNENENGSERTAANESSIKKVLQPSLALRSLTRQPITLPSTQSSVSLELPPGTTSSTMFDELEKNRPSLPLLFILSETGDLSIVVSGLQEGTLLRLQLASQPPQEVQRSLIRSGIICRQFLVHPDSSRAYLVLNSTTISGINGGSSSSDGDMSMNENDSISQTVSSFGCALLTFDLSHCIPHVTSPTTLRLALLREFCLIAFSTLQTIQRRWNYFLHKTLHACLDLPHSIRLWKQMLVETIEAPNYLKLSKYLRRLNVEQLVNNSNTMNELTASSVNTMAHVVYRALDMAHVIAATTTPTTPFPCTRVTTEAATRTPTATSSRARARSSASLINIIAAMREAASNCMLKIRREAEHEAELMRFILERVQLDMELPPQLLQQRHEMQVSRWMRRRERRTQRSSNMAAKKEGTEKSGKQRHKNRTSSSSDRHSKHSTGNNTNEVVDDGNMKKGTREERKEYVSDSSDKDWEAEYDDNDNDNDNDDGDEATTTTTTRRSAMMKAMMNDGFFYENENMTYENRLGKAPQSSSVSQPLSVHQHPSVLRSLYRMEKGQSTAGGDAGFSEVEEEELEMNEKEEEKEEGEEKEAKRTENMNFGESRVFSCTSAAVDRHACDALQEFLSEFPPHTYCKTESLPFPIIDTEEDEEESPNSTRFMLDLIIIPVEEEEAPQPGSNHIHHNVTSNDSEEDDMHNINSTEITTTATGASITRVAIRALLWNERNECRTNNNNNNNSCSSQGIEEQRMKEKHTNKTKSHHRLATFHIEESITLLLSSRPLPSPSASYSSNVSVKGNEIPQHTMHMVLASECVPLETPPLLNNNNNNNTSKDGPSYYNQRLSGENGPESGEGNSDALQSLFCGAVDANDEQRLIVWLNSTQTSSNHIEGNSIHVGENPVTSSPSPSTTVLLSIHSCEDGIIAAVENDDDDDEEHENEDAENKEDDNDDNDDNNTHSKAILAVKGLRIGSHSEEKNKKPNNALLNSNGVGIRNVVGDGFQVTISPARGFGVVVAQEKFIVVDFIE